MDLNTTPSETPSAEAEERETPLDRLDTAYDALRTMIVDKIAQAKANKILPYDRALIDRIGNQASSGHSICCPSFSCAYADAVMDGTVNSHSYYTCSSCSWRDWGGGNSSFRNLGSAQAVLREAYDQIAVGRPTVVHVSASYGEHWVPLIGFQDVANPDELSLSNFICIDPWDGVEQNAGARFRLYGDNCQHISSR